MRARHTGVVVARGIGLGLIVIGASTGVGNSELFFPSVSSGWTSYSPLATTTTTATPLHDSYFSMAVLWLPCLVQVVLGAGLIFFSRQVGSWLSSGLKDGDEEV